MSDAPSLDALARRAAELLAAATPGPWEKRGKLVVAPCDRPGRHLLIAEDLTAKAGVNWQNVALMVAAPDLARGLVAAVDALRAERDQRDALAAAVREERRAEAARTRASVPLLSVADALGVFVDFAECRPTPAMTASQAAAEAHATARRATNALLSGAAPDVVRAGVVREYLDAEERWREGIGAYLPGEDVTAYVARRDAERMRVGELHKAMVAALAAAEGR